VHRRHRAGWEKVRESLIGMRRNQCVNCGAAKWVPSPGREGPAWGAIVAVIAVGIGASALMFSRSGATNSAPAAMHRQVTVTAASEQAKAALQSDYDIDHEAVVPSPAEPAEPAEAELAAQIGDPKAVAESAVLIPRELRAVTPRWTGERMEVLIEADALPADYTLIYVASSGGYVIDLPGEWKIAPGLRRSRSFTRSNLSALDVGLHETFLRVVLRTQIQTPKPDISKDAQALRILL